MCYDVSIEVQHEQIVFIIYNKEIKEVSTSEKKSRIYTQEYKNTIVDLFNSGKTYVEISSEYGVPNTTIRQWVDKNNNSTDTNTLTGNEDDEIKAMCNVLGISIATYYKHMNKKPFKY